MLLCISVIFSSFKTDPDVQICPGDGVNCSYTENGQTCNEWKCKTCGAIEIKTIE